MEKPTKWGTSTYHPTIYWVEPNVSFIGSPLCHIPSMNFTLTTNQTMLLRVYHISHQNWSRISRPKESTYTSRIYHISYQGIPRPKQYQDLLQPHHMLVEGWLQQYKHGCLQISPTKPWRIFLSPTSHFTTYPTFTNLGITRTLGIFLILPHLVLRPFSNPTEASKRNPITPWLSRNGKIRLKTTITPRTTHENDSERTKHTHAYTMHAKTSKKIMHATQYL